MKFTLTQALQLTGTSKPVYDARRRAKRAGGLQLMHWMHDLAGYLDNDVAVHKHETGRARYGMEQVTALAVFDHVVGSYGLSLDDADYVVGNSFAALCDAIGNANNADRSAIADFHIALFKFEGDAAHRRHHAGTIAECTYFYLTGTTAANANRGMLQGTTHAIEYPIPTSMLLVDVGAIYRAVSAKVRSRLGIL